MSIFVTLSTRVASSLAIVFRLALARFGLAPLILTAAALAAFLLSLRSRTPAEPHRRRYRRSTDHDGLPRGATSGTAPGHKPAWLARVRRVTLGVSCSITSPGQWFQSVASSSSNSASTDNDLKLQLQPDVADALRALATMFELFIVMRVPDDESESAVLAALDRAAIFGPGKLDRRKIVFCETEGGRASVARQLEPQLHVDESSTVVASLQRFMHLVALVAPDAKGSHTDAMGRNVARFTSLPALLM